MLRCWRYTYGYTLPVGDSVCSAAIHKSIHVARMGTVASVLAINLWTNVVSVVTEAAVLPIHI